MPEINYISSLRIGILLVLTGMVGFSCVSNYEAEIEDEPELISIEGSLIKGELEQTVRVSKTASLSYAQIIPVRACDVTLLDEFDNAWHYKDLTGGVYRTTVPDEELVHGRQYKIRVITSDGNVYESDYEMLNTGIDVDSVYYAIEDKVDEMTGDPYSGVQFYLDVKAGEEESRYFRWRIDETYEYTSFAPISYYYLDETHTPIVPQDEWAVYRCWRGEEITGLFQSSTMNLSQNEKKKIPLNYVSDQSERLLIKYSLQVKQYTLGENAFNYFEQNRLATEEADGLYTRQPRQPITNIQNVDDDEERVLGYFWVSTQTTKRIFVPFLDELDVRPEECANWEYSDLEDGEGPFPIYMYDDPILGKRYTSSRDCFDCTRRDGSTTKPDYWE
ncbi:MAG: DUF4249 domain-containing protein [Bacteroidota bacterium]|nr:DUF4249 domain-containing protein [Bacteroidota bacterium]